jgi:amino-acid N-acetyltransferase
MLPRSEENVRQTIDDWLVAVEVTPAVTISEAAVAFQLPQDAVTAFGEQATGAMEERIVGCGALVPLNDKLVEVRSLAIHESQHGNGLGSSLVLQLLQMARERGYAQVCALTLRPKFFIRLGFEQVDRWSISPKVWQACIYCPKFHRCDEVAVLMNLATVPAGEEERSRQPGWNRLLKWGEWQPLRLAYRYEYQESYGE